MRGEPRADRPMGPGGGTTRWIMASTVILLAGILSVGYLITTRLSRVEEGVGRVTQRVEHLEAGADALQSVAESARETADRAANRAREAEQNALEAARGRGIAEAETRNAQAARIEAEVRATSAAEEAALARADAAAARDDLDRLERERREELDRLERALSSIVETRRTALGLVMSLGSDAIEFEFDRADLDASDRELLSRIAGILLTSNDYSVAVYGHTDDIGSVEYNQELSERRAQSVRDYLVEAGVRPEIVSTLGYGKSSPRVDGTTAEARAKNRRVEIAIIDVNLGMAREVLSAQP